MALFIYPTIVAWTWGGGWLTAIGYSDFAGSGVVHLCGGVAGLVATIILKPREGRFGFIMTDDKVKLTDEESKLARRSSIDADEFRPSSIAFAALGVMILWFGF